MHPFYLLADSYYTANSHAKAMPGIGNDPVFNPKSTMYNKDVVQEIDRWYNTTKSAGEMSPGEVPYGFQHEPLPGQWTVLN